MPLVHSFAPETTQLQCRGSNAATAINANFPLFESLNGGEREAEDVVFLSADVAAFASTEKHADDTTAIPRSRDGMVDGVGEDGNRSIGPMPDIVSIAAAPSNNTSSSEGFQVQTPSATTATAGLEEEQLRHNLLHHYGTENNEYHHHAYANLHLSAQGPPSGGGGTVEDPRGKEALHSNLPRGKGDLGNNGRKRILHKVQ